MCAKIPLSLFDIAGRLFTESHPISWRQLLSCLLQVRQPLLTPIGNAIRQTPTAGRPPFEKSLAGEPKQVAVEGTPIRLGMKPYLRFIWRKKSACTIENR